MRRTKNPSRQTPRWWIVAMGPARRPFFPGHPLDVTIVPSVRPPAGVRHGNFMDEESAIDAAAALGFRLHGRPQQAAAERAKVASAALKRAAMEARTTLSSERATKARPRLLSSFAAARKRAAQMDIGEPPYVSELAESDRAAAERFARDIEINPRRRRNPPKRRAKKAMVRRLAIQAARLRKRGEVGRALGALQAKRGRTRRSIYKARKALRPRRRHRRVVRSRGRRRIRG